MRTQRFLLVAALGGLVLAGVALAAPAPRLCARRTPVSGLAMDGSTVAVSTAWARGHCERVVAWNPLGPSLKALGRATSCDETSTGPRDPLPGSLRASAIAWIADGGGNAHDSQLFVASLDKPQAATRLAFATRDIDSGDGTYVGHLHGIGSLLVYATWTVCDTGDGTVKRCPGTVLPGTIVNAKLWRIEGTTAKKLIASADDELAPIAVAAGRILVARADGTLEAPRCRRPHPPDLRARPAAAAGRPRARSSLSSPCATRARCRCRRQSSSSASTTSPPGRSCGRSPACRRADRDRAALLVPDRLVTGCLPDACRPAALPGRRRHAAGVRARLGPCTSCGSRTART